MYNFRKYIDSLREKYFIYKNCDIIKHKCFYREF